MYDAGYKKQVCIDTSAVVIEQNMKLNAADRPEMVAPALLTQDWLYRAACVMVQIWLVKDCTKLDYPENFFE